MHLEALALFAVLLIVAVKDFKFVAGMKQLERQVGCLPGDPFGAARAADVDAKRRLIDASGITHEK